MKVQSEKRRKKSTNLKTWCLEPTLTIDLFTFCFISFHFVNECMIFPAEKRHIFFRLPTKHNCHKTAIPRSIVFLSPPSNKQTSKQVNKPNRQQQTVNISNLSICSAHLLQSKAIFYHCLHSINIKFLAGSPWSASCLTIHFFIHKCVAIYSIGTWVSCADKHSYGTIYALA